MILSLKRQIFAQAKDGKKLTLLFNSFLLKQDNFFLGKNFTTT